MGNCGDTVSCGCGVRYEITGDPEAFSGLMRPSVEEERSVEYWKAKAMMYKEENRAIQRCLDKKKHYIRRLTNDILHMKARIADIILRYAPNDGGAK